MREPSSGISETVTKKK